MSKHSDFSYKNSVYKNSVYKNSGYKNSVYKNADYKNAGYKKSQHYYASSCASECDEDGFEHAVKKLVQAQFALCKAATKVLFQGIESFLSCLPHIKQCEDDFCCDVPSPCWMPISLGEVCCKICPEGTGQIQFTITNEDYRPRTFTLSDRGSHKGKVTFSTEQLLLQPKERRTVTATFSPPTLDKHYKNAEFDLLIWVQGCKAYYLRWRVAVCKTSQSCCIDICINDSPDYELHWYDHFYCHRCCYDNSSDYSHPSLCKEVKTDE